MIIDIPDIFKGQPVTILGGGYSLTGFDFSRVRKPVIAVNYSIKNRPDAEICIGCDESFFSQNSDIFKDFKGIMVTDRGDHLYPGVKKIAYESPMTDNKMDVDWHCQLVNLSGFTAIALAFQLGAKKVYLLGFDGGFNGISNHYHHNPNFESKEIESLNNYYQWFKDYPVINVVNPEIFESKIEYFKKVNMNTDFYL